ncbi:hypothetical protein [Micromonospora wenchangensis]|uniref:hypothetical protein n=1 Tax=Micromonospora wenchangensis TaxID=1185415 RepID=UPI001FE8F6A1|nr:hypothetical protein [Micromonospora wenchangensis]
MFRIVGWQLACRDSAAPGGLPGRWHSCQIGAEKLPEWLCQLVPFDGPILTKVELLEEPLVDLAPDRRGSGGVVPLTVASDQQGVLQRLDHFIQARCRRGDLRLCFGQGVGESVHLGLEKIDWHSTRVVGLHELRSLILEPSQALLGALGVHLGVDALGLELCQDGVAHLCDPLGAGLERPIEPGDPILDGVKPNPTSAAVVGLQLLLDTVVVLVDPAVASMAAEDKATAAGTAEDRAA